MALDYCQNFVSAQYLENELMEFFISMDVNQICVGIITYTFVQIYNRVMALGYCQNMFPLNSF